MKGDSMEYITDCKMKEMEYGTNRKIELLLKGKYKGFSFYILNLGTHPTAYIEIPKEHKYFNKNYEEIEEIEVNGGLTFSSNKLHISETEKLEGWFIGWDYAHYGDYMNLGTYECEGKKWTTKEILEEDVIPTIDKLYENNDEGR